MYETEEKNDIIMITSFTFLYGRQVRPSNIIRHLSVLFSHSFDGLCREKRDWKKLVEIISRKREKKKYCWIQVEPDDKTRSMKSKPVMVAICVDGKSERLNMKYEIRFVCVSLFAYESLFSLLFRSPNIRMCVCVCVCDRMTFISYIRRNQQKQAER